MKEKIILGGYELWVEIDLESRCAKIFSVETSKHPIYIDIMGDSKRFWVNSHELNNEEKKELEQYIKSKNLSF